jgi:hypothetical protein
MASSKVIGRNSWPSEEAPKLKIGSWMPVLPSKRCCTAHNLPPPRAKVASILRQALWRGFQAVRSPHYRSILRKLADQRLATTFRRADLLARLAPQETRVLDSFLNRMRKLGAVVPDEEAGRGTYRFANQLHALYFWMEAQRAKGEKPA